jgi:hypothetical protein
VALQLSCGPGPLRGQIEAELRVHGQPLRWAITQACCSPDGTRALQIEAIVYSPMALV